MAGVIGRSGRPPKMQLDWFNKVADLTFRQAYFLLRDDNVPLLDRVRVCLPVALKRVPDQVNVKVAHLQLNDQLAQRIAQLLEQKCSPQPIEPSVVTSTEFEVVDEAKSTSGVHLGGQVASSNSHTAQNFEKQLPLNPETNPSANNA